MSDHVHLLPIITVKVFRFLGHVLPEGQDHDHDLVDQIHAIGEATPAKVANGNEGDDRWRQASSACEDFCIEFARYQILKCIFMNKYHVF